MGQAPQQARTILLRQRLAARAEGRAAELADALAEDDQDEQQLQDRQRAEVQIGHVVVPEPNRVQALAGCVRLEAVRAMHQLVTGGSGGDEESHEYFTDTSREGGRHTVSFRGIFWNKGGSREEL